MRLRRKPVRRDEVLIIRDPRGWFLKTMPLGTYRVVSYTNGLTEFVGVPALWQPLLNELTAEAEAEEERRTRTYQSLINGTPEERRFAPRFAPYRPELPETMFSTLRWKNEVHECNCDHCGIRFLWRRWAHDRHYGGIRCCSNQCKAERAKANKRHWRKLNPVSVSKNNRSRTLKRAEARAGRTCEQCGKTIEAARSTRRFCSDLCRIRAHHQQRRLARTR